MRKELYRFLDTNGDGSGSINGAVDGSVTPVTLKIKPGVGEGYHIYRMIIHIRSGRVGFDADSYGNLNALTNGIEINIHNSADDSVMVRLCGGFHVRNNAQWGRLCYDVIADDFGFGFGDRFVTVRWTFSKSGQPLKLSEDEYLAVTISDNLSNLTEHSFMAQGIKI